MRRLDESTMFAVRGQPSRNGPALPASKESWELGEGARLTDGRVVLAPLGGGARHELYLAWDERLGRRVVAKLLRPHLADEPAALAGLRREAAALAEAAHPAIVRCLGTDADGRPPHLVLEHVEGPSLARLVKRHGIVPLPRLVALGARLAEALGALGARGLVHLDVSPTHVIAGPEPRLVGLGCARRYDVAADSTLPLGADAYLAPELCAPDAPPSSIGPAVDVFALGATLHHAARGAVPFPRRRGTHGSADPAIRFPQLHDEPAPLPAFLDARFKDLLLAMLSPDPRARPTAPEVASAMESLRAA